MRCKLYQLCSLAALILNVGCGVGTSSEDGIAVAYLFDSPLNKPLEVFFTSLESDMGYSSEGEFHKMRVQFNKQCQIRFRAAREEDPMTVTRYDKRLDVVRQIELIRYKVQLLAYFKDQDVNDVGALNSEPWGDTVIIPSSLEQNSSKHHLSAHAKVNPFEDYRYKNSPLYEQLTKKAQFRLLRFMQTTKGCVTSN